MAARRQHHPKSRYEMLTISPLGRHVLLLPKGAEKLPEFPDLTASWKGVAKGIWRMCTVL